MGDEGVVVVTAAGNQGPRPGQYHSSGKQPKVITVGSSDLLEGRSAIWGERTNGGMRVQAGYCGTWK